MTVNALATGLIVFRIFKVFQQVKVSSEDKILGAIQVGGDKLRSIIFLLIESGMGLFAIQLARVVTTFVETDAAAKAVQLMIGINQQLIVIIIWYFLILFHW